MKSLLFRAALAAGVLGGAGLFSFYALSFGSAVQFESLESVTGSGSPVFNRIHFEQVGHRDIWMMQQSHVGLVPAHEKWDRLAIVVDRDVRTARFFQLEPGKLHWSAGAREVPFRVACYLCHSNGPRALRPNFSSAAQKVSLFDQLRVLAWNLRIKTYGPLSPHREMLKPGIRFMATGAVLNQPLRVKTCIKCHQNSWWGRGTLTRQHFMPIRFMLKNRFMPPPGFSLSEAEKREIEGFLHGLL